MKRLVFLALLLFLSVSAHAHERQVFEINGQTVQLVVGSLSEPVYVDDKTGLDLTVTLIAPDANNSPITGLEETLMLELQAGGKTKSFPIEAAWMAPGKYKTTFYPTIAGTYAYRLYGMILDTPFDVTFTCNPSGHAMHGTTDDTMIEISPLVKRVSKAGGFGCPLPKASAGFPEDSESIAGLVQSLSDHSHASESLPESESNGLVPVALGIAILSLLISLYVVWKK